MQLYYSTFIRSINRLRTASVAWHVDIGAEKLWGNFGYFAGEHDGRSRAIVDRVHIHATSFVVSPHF